MQNTKAARDQLNITQYLKLCSKVHAESYTLCTLILSYRVAFVCFPHCNSNDRVGLVTY
jgi:hypothetical protein